MSSENHKFFYSAFNEIVDDELRAWNRYNVILNMDERFGLGSDIKSEYFKQFTWDDQFVIFRLATRIEEFGYEPTRRELFRKELIDA